MTTVAVVGATGRLGAQVVRVVDGLDVLHGPARDAFMAAAAEFDGQVIALASTAATSDDVREAMSHPQALGQSRHYLRERGIVPMAYADTAGAAAYVAELGDPAACAVAPPIAAALYGLRIVAEKIEDSPDNTTRFVVLAREPLGAAELAGRTAMTTFVFEVKNIPAALYKAMGGFATNGVNMTKLESYQRGASFAATRFYADIVGAPGDPAVDRALEELAFHCKELRVLGSYPQELVRG